MAVDPRVRERGGELVLVEAEQPRHCGGRGDFHEDDVVEPDAVEGVVEREHALNLVCDHRGVEDIGDGHRLPRSREVIGDGEDRAEVVGGMPPLRREPRIVVVEPADQRSGLEGRLHRVELVRRRRDTGAVRHDGAGHDRAQQGSAGLVRRGECGAAERVREHEPRGAERRFREVARLERVACELDEQRVGLRPEVELRHLLPRRASSARS